MLRKKLILVISIVALCLITAPVMADFVDLTAEYTKMTVTSPSGDGTTASTTIGPLTLGTSTMDMYIKDSDGNILQSLLAEPYDLTAMLDFTGSVNDYSAVGSLVVNDTGGTKIAADFMSNSLTFSSTYNPMFRTYIGTVVMTGYLTPQGTETSILLGGDPWEFETISLAESSTFDHGEMMVFEYTVTYETFQDFLKVSGAEGSGFLSAQIHSTPIPAAVLLGVIGLGVAGFKLRKFA